MLAYREGYTSELDLLVADFVMLEEELAALAQALGSGVDKAAAGTSDKASASAAAAAAGGGVLPLGLIGEDVLEKLAVEIPDMRVRVGVM